MRNIKAKFIEGISNNPFSSSPSYSVNIINLTHTFSGVGSLALYNNELSDILESNPLFSPFDSINYLTPDFQRENTKWTLPMKQRFIENLLSGAKTTIMLYGIHEQGLDHCMILDGLQRLTSIASFVENEFPIFGDIYWKDIDFKVSLSGLIINIYQFESDSQACQFYIDMNRGITHSESDLESAYKFIERINEQ